MSYTTNAGENFRIFDTSTGEVPAHVAFMPGNDDIDVANVLNKIVDMNRDYPDISGKVGPFVVQVLAYDYEKSAEEWRK